MKKPFAVAALVLCLLATTSQEQVCYEIGDIECTNTSAGMIASWPVSQDFRDHILDTIDRLRLKNELSQDELIFCIPIFNAVKNEFRGQVASSSINEFNMTQPYRGVLLDGRHGPHFSSPHYMLNRNRWGLMDTLVMHEVAHHRGYAGNGATAAEECIDL